MQTRRNHKEAQAGWGNRGEIYSKVMVMVEAKRNGIRTRAVSGMGKKGAGRFWKHCQDSDCMAVGTG